MKRMFILFLSAFITTSFCFAQTKTDKHLAEAKQYYNAGEYEKAFPIYKRLAAKKNSEAEYKMGCYFFFGYAPVVEDYEQAYKWFTKAVGHNPKDAKSINAIGVMYKNGLFLPQDYKEAYRHYIKSGELGEVYGYGNAGLMLMELLFDNASVPYDSLVKDIRKPYASVPNYYSVASPDVNHWGFKPTVTEDENYTVPVIDSIGQLNFDVIPSSPEEECCLLAAKMDTAYGLFKLAYYYDWMSSYNQNLNHFRGADIKVSGKNSDLCTWTNIERMYEMAAVKGNADAQVYLGFAYICCGKYDEALSWFEKAKLQSRDVSELCVNKREIRFSVDGCEAVCKHFKTKPVYTPLVEGDFLYQGINASDYTSVNGCVYVHVVGSDGKVGMIKINKDGQLMSKTPIKYDGRELDDFIEYKEDGVLFNNQPF